MFNKINNKYNENKYLILNSNNFEIGCLVVHFKYGIGRYQGLTILEIGGIKAEYLILYYADNDILYVPISSIHLVTRYENFNHKSVVLNKLGTPIWNKIKQKSFKKICDIAVELLDIYAKRNLTPGFTFQQDKIKYQQFCQHFPFQTTIDQEQAINSVLNDMCKPIKMDRLICGDVGFGKTEVAMRAAFLAVINDKQVTVLVPTTLLAKQHFDHFSKRFTNWPIKIEMLSRFCSIKKQKQIINLTANGIINILIGTHKLLDKKIYWKKLGLLIIDEEHRFGVRHKELIKSKYTNVDILTLTATPIPRTLNMAMSGIRDISIITTPPSGRMAVKTFICEYNELLIRKAILREISRGGQVYYLYNNVKYIENIKNKLMNLVPEAEFIIGHGQMNERELDLVMTDFYCKKYNVLICSTIIETGIDIPNCNTIIIERSDNFGLAQLHQLRGRVGRSYHQAYAYFLIPNLDLITIEAKKRLEVITSLEDLGAGFTLATHDLEIRGVGELIGKEQSGHVTSIGFTFYMELLKNAVQDLKESKIPSLNDLTLYNVDIELKMPLLLPNNYIQDIDIRLFFYKKIANAKYKYELKQIMSELIKRFGEIPQSGKRLLKVALINIYAKELGIKRIEANIHGGIIEFNKNNKINEKFLISLLHESPDIYKLKNSYKLNFTKNLIDNEERLLFINDLISQFRINMNL